MSDVLEATTPGWRPDPSGRYEWRYWDGGWTNRVANSAKRAAPAEAASAPPIGDTSVGDTSVGDTPAPTAAEAAAAGMAESFGAPEPTPAASPASVSAPDPASTRPSAPTPGSTAPAFASTSVFPSEVLPAPAPEPVVPAPPASGAAAPVWTFPDRHDGLSGTQWDAPYIEPGTPSDTGTDASGPRSGFLSSVVRFVRSLWEQEESYHSPNAGVQLPPHPKEATLAPPPSYGRAGLVMLAALGVAVGAYLPWISVSNNGAPYERTGYEMGRSWGFVLSAAAFAIAALLATRHRWMGWVTMAMSVVVAALVAHQLLDIHDQVTTMSARVGVEARVAVGLWVMLSAAAIGLVAAFRLDTPRPAA